MTSVASAPKPAPRLTLKSSSCSIATLPVSRTRHGASARAALSRAAIARMSAIAAAAGCMRLKSSAGCSAMMRRVVGGARGAR